MNTLQLSGIKEINELVGQFSIQASILNLTEAGKRDIQQMNHENTGIQKTVIKDPLTTLILGFHKIKIIEIRGLMKLEN